MDVLLSDDHVLGKSKTTWPGHGTYAYGGRASLGVTYNETTRGLSRKIGQ